MRERLQRIFAAIALTVCVGAPMVEMFDHWDHTLQNGNDTESNLIVVVLSVGVAFIAAAAVIRQVRAPRVRAFSSAFRTAAPGPLELPIILPIPHASPPTLLRV